MKRVFGHRHHRLLMLTGALVIFVVLFWPKDAPGIKSFDQEVLGVSGTPAVLLIDEGQTEMVYESRVYRARFKFNALAPHWKESDAGEENRKFELRVSKDGADWSEWTEIEMVGEMKDDGPHPDKMFAETPIFIEEAEYFQFNVMLSRDRAALISPKVSEMVITYIDSTTPAIKKVENKVSSLFKQSAAAADQGPGFVTRAGWGSPDPYGYSLSGGSKWYPSYEPVTQVFIHHTVNSNTSSDFPAVVRAIWQYHTYTRGWGDIGYNYLVDGNGAIYEGRFGGDNVIAGHVLGYNKGSMGIALIGCFQPGSTCNNLNGGSTSGPSAAMLDKLYDLLGWKTKNYEIDPEGSHTFCGTSSVNFACLNLNNIAAHRDAQATSCPGDLTVNQLSAIRSGAESRKANKFPYSAKQLSFSTINLPETGEESVTLSFKNTGSATWSNSVNRLWLKTSNPHDRTSAFQGSGWTTNQHAALLNEATVAPGGTGTFTFNLKNAGVPPDLYHEGFRLVSEGNTELHGYFSVMVRPPTFRWSHVSTSYSTGTPIMSPGQTQTITVVAKNTGTTTWERSGTLPIKLGTWLPGRTSKFQHGSWPDPVRPALLSENTVSPGNNGTFVFTVQAPNEFNQFGERMSLVAEGLTWFNDPGFQVYFNVVNGYQWQHVSTTYSTGTPIMSPGETQTVTVVANNTGSATWSNSGANPIKLGSWQPGRMSAFVHTSWPHPERPAVLQEASVAPGANGTFVFTVRAPSVFNQYGERFNLVAENLTWFNDTGMQVYFNIINGFKWQHVSTTYSTGTPIMSPGATQTVTVVAQNTGTATWSNTGSHPIKLGSWQPGRMSAFAHTSWPHPERPAVLQEASVSPGANGTFVFTVKAPSGLGQYGERFNLVAEFLIWFNDPGFQVYFNVVNG